MRRKPCVRNCSKEREGLYNGNVQQNPLCAASCVTKDIPISARLSPTILYRGTNSVLRLAHLCPAVDSMRRRPCVRNCLREREGLYNGNVQLNPICAASCVVVVVVVVFLTLTDPLRIQLWSDDRRNQTESNREWERSRESRQKKTNKKVTSKGHRRGVTKDIPISPRLSPTIFLSQSKFGTPTSTPLYSTINRLYAQNPVFAIIHDESVKVYLHMHNGNVQQNPLCVESCVTKEFPISPRLWRTIFDPDAN